MVSKEQKEKMEYFFGDFTESEYRKLLRIAKSKWKMICCDQIKEKGNLCLWRHDIDFSVHRASKMAEIEKEEEVRATYFVMLHSDFYSVMEKGINEKLSNIGRAGHDIGLHFDPTFYLFDEKEDFHVTLAENLRREKESLENIINRKVRAFSFHLPGTLNLGDLEDNEIAGMINVYGQSVKRSFRYCSDSNGYWRFERLKDFLSNSDDGKIQILTHPSLWQRRAMAPKERIWRCIRGRGKNQIFNYDELLWQCERQNVLELAEEFAFLKKINKEYGYFLEELWVGRYFQILLVELWKLHGKQLNRLCRVQFQNIWFVPEKQVKEFFEEICWKVPPSNVFDAAFGVKIGEFVDADSEAYYQWYCLRNRVVLGIEDPPEEILREGIGFVFGVLKKTAKWGVDASCVGEDGLNSLRRDDSRPIEKKSEKLACFSGDKGRSGLMVNKKWEDLVRIIKRQEVTPLDEKK